MRGVISRWIRIARLATQARIAIETEEVAATMTEPSGIMLESNMPVSKNEAATLDAPEFEYN